MTVRAHTVSLNPAIDRTLWIDTFAAGASHMVTAEHIQAGGKGFNVAAGLVSLGVQVTACGWLGADNAARFEAALADRSIADAMERVPGATRENLQLTDTARQQTTSIDLPGIAFDTAARDTAESALLRTLRARLQPGDWCLLTGSLPPGIDAGTLARLAGAAHARGARVVIDTGGEVLGAVLQRLSGTGLQPVFVKPNRSELEAFAGRALPSVADVMAAAREVVALGVPHVLVTLGADGAVAVSAHAAWHATVPVVPVCTTVGAGDAVVAGTVAALIGGAPFADAARFGLACAVRRVQQRCPDLPARAVLDVTAVALHPAPWPVSS